MPKFRTKSAIKKRFRITKTGKVVHLHEGNAKLKAHKSSNQKRRYDTVKLLTNKKSMKAVKQALGK